MSIAPVIIRSVCAHSSTMIFMHGLGESGHSWSSALVMMRTQTMKVVCPIAPTRHSTMCGISMPLWYDLKTLDMCGPEDEEGIKAASKYIRGLINVEIQQGIRSDRIVLGGFSQGAALALYTALTFEKPLGGVVALSGWLPLHKQFPAIMTNDEFIPIFQAHGDYDPVVEYQLGQLTAGLLKKFMQNVEFKSYRGLGHTISKDEIQDVRQRLGRWVF